MCECAWLQCAYLVFVTPAAVNDVLVRGDEAVAREGASLLVEVSHEKRVLLRRHKHPTHGNTTSAQRTQQRTSTCLSRTTQAATPSPPPPGGACTSSPMSQPSVICWNLFSSALCEPNHDTTGQVNANEHRASCSSKCSVPWPHARAASDTNPVPVQQ